MASWADTWLETYKEGEVQASTLEDYRYMVGYIKKGVGNMRLTDVQPIHVMNFFKSINHYSHSAQKKTRFVLSAMYEAAIDNDLCTKNPVRNVKIAKNIQVAEKEVFTEEEPRIILDFAKEDKLFGLAAYIMLNSEVRSGEMRGMTVEQFDFERGTIHIDRAVKHTEELGLPKGNKTRIVPLEPDVAEFIASKLSGKSGYVIGGSHYVSRAGFRSRYLHFFNRLNKHLVSKGKNPIKMHSPHATRHTYSTLRQKHGMPVAILMRIMGHSSTNVTDKYTHLSDVATLTEAVQKYGFNKQTVKQNKLTEETEKLMAV
jgi:integrase